MNVLRKLSGLLEKKGYNRTFRQQVENALDRSLRSGEKVLKLVEGKENKEYVFLLATDMGVLYILTDLWPEPKVKRLSYEEILSTNAIIGTDLRIHLELECTYEKYKVATYNLRATLGFLKTLKEVAAYKQNLQQMLKQAVR